MTDDKLFNALNVSIYLAWFCLLASIPAYFALYNYLDQVMPSTFGVQAPPCFCLKKNKVDENPTEIEMTEVGMAPVKIRALRKSFGKLHALDNFNMDIE